MEKLKMCEKIDQLEVLLSDSANITNTITSLFKERNFGETDFLGYAFDSLPFGIFVKDDKGNVLDCNKAFLEMNNLPKEKLLMKNWVKHSVVGDQQIKKYFENDLRIMRTGKPEQIFEKLGVNDKKVLTWKLPLKVDNEIKGVIGVVMDITEIVKHVKEEFNNATNRGYTEIPS